MQTNSSYYEGQWANGKKHGRGKFTDRNAVIEGNWVNGKMHGDGGTMTQGLDGATYKGQWRNGALHGRATVTPAAAGGAGSGGAGAGSSGGDTTRSYSARFEHGEQVPLGEQSLAQIHEGRQQFLEKHRGNPPQETEESITNLLQELALEEHLPSIRNDLEKHLKEGLSQQTEEDVKELQWKLMREKLVQKLHDMSVDFYAALE